MTRPLFTDRAEAGWMLVERLRAAGLAASRRAAADRLLVLAIPRGGVEIGAVLARGLGADLDVVLSRKLRAPRQPELALGAVAEDGRSPSIWDTFTHAGNEPNNHSGTQARADLGLR